MLRGFHRADSVRYKPPEAKRVRDKEYDQYIRVVEVDGEKLEIVHLRAGEVREVKGRKEISIFHPGFALDVDSAKKLIMALAREMGEVVGVSPLGAGRSSTPKEITASRESYLYLDLIDRLNFRPESHQLISIGYSSGCFAALTTAIQRPELFGGVVIANSVLNNWDKLPKLAFDYARNVAGHFVRRPKMTAELLADFLKKRPSASGLYYQGVKAGSFRKEIHQAIQSFCGDLLVLESEGDVPGKMKIPEENSRSGKVRQLNAEEKARALCDLAPRAKSRDCRCLPGPHTWLLEHPEQFAKIISEWRDKLSGEYPRLE